MSHLLFADRVSQDETKNNQSVEHTHTKRKRWGEVNAKQRKKLENIISAIEDIVSDEQEKLDNLEENFSGTERYEKIEEGISALEEAIENIQLAIDD